MNATELLVWSRLRGRQVAGWKFRRQQPIGPYFVDFYCPAAKLIVEIDGPAHDHEALWAYDARRQAWLEAEGNYFVRIPVEAITESLADVLDGLEAELLEREALGFMRRPCLLGPSGPSGHLPIDGEELSYGHVPINGEELPLPTEGEVGVRGLTRFYFGSSLIDAELMQ